MNKDMLQISLVTGYPLMVHPLPYMNAVYQIYTTQLMSKMADAIGNTQAKQKYDAKYDALKILLS